MLIILVYIFMNKTAVAEIGNHRKPQKDWKETDKRQAYLMHRKQPFSQNEVPASRSSLHFQEVDSSPSRHQQQESQTSTDPELTHIVQT